jgi:hypothetical protein
MTPREALTIVSESVNTHTRSATEEERLTKALVVLDRLVSKDEAEGKYAKHDAVKRDASRVRCTCATGGPCAVWGHS